MEVNKMETSKLKVELRNGTGKEINKKFRRKGNVPGILYSPHDKENILLKVKRENLLRLLSSKTHQLIDLEIDDGKKKVSRLAVIKDFQYNTLKKQIVHVDFYGVTLKEKLTMEINIELIGKPIGAKDGGILNVELRKVEIECLPSQVPESLKVDLSNLKIGDNITVGEIQVPKGVEVLTKSDRIVAALVPPAKEEEVVKEVVEGEAVTEEKEVTKGEEKVESKTETPSSAPKKEFKKEPKKE
jgi:large subunit ribosomal protein L25